MPRPSDEEILHRFGYHPGNDQTKEQHRQVREAYIAFATFLSRVLPDSRAKSRAFTILQEAAMWSNYAIAEQAEVVLPSDDASV